MIEAIVRDAIGVEGDLDTISDFVASVDWSGMVPLETEITELLGRIEQWDTEFVEKDITEAEYTARLRSVLTAPGVAV